ncbi:MAG: hypothetical protein RL235_426, partial [Chlamydiota bacterium]
MLLLGKRFTIKSFDKKAEIGLRINREIRADRVRVITESGDQLGVMLLRDALARAEEAGLDLV